MSDRIDDQVPTQTAPPAVDGGNLQSTQTPPPTDPINNQAPTRSAPGVDSRPYSIPTTTVPSTDHDGHLTPNSPPIDPKDDPAPTSSAAPAVDDGLFSTPTPPPNTNVNFRPRRGSINDSTLEHKNEEDEETALLSHQKGARMVPSRLRSLSFSAQMAVRGWASDISLPVYICVILFAWASWIAINGLWVELPLLVTTLPESWNLPSYLAIIIQIANIGPIVYTIANKTAPDKVKEWQVVYIIITIGAVASLLLAFMWDDVTVISGQKHSLSLLVLTSFLALVDCTSSVVFLPYMAQLKPQYMTALYIGEGLSGMIPGLVGLIQGTGTNPICVNESVVIVNHTSLINITEYHLIPVYEPASFSIEVFFFFLFAMMLVSGIAFTFLHFLPYCRKERIILHSVENQNKNRDKYPTTQAQSNRHAEKNYGSNQETDRSEPVGSDRSELVGSHVRNLSPAHDEKSNAEITVDNLQYTDTSLSLNQVIYVLVITAWVNSLANGILPSTLSYSCLPYGNLAYTLAVRLSTIANPLICLLALFVKMQGLIKLGILTLFGTLLAGGQLYLAALSPDPPMKGEVAGVVLVIVAQIVISACFSYVKVTTASILNAHGGQKALFWCGAVTQIGSCLGAFAAFMAVNVFKALKSEPPC